jgi:hypothetical protein
MARLQTSFVLGYHGCDTLVGEGILSGDIDLSMSEKDYDWLGPGIYFWESDPQRAWEWADQRRKSGAIAKPFVVGAAIDLGNCLDLLARDSLELLVESYRGLSQVVGAAGAGAKLPENRGKDRDKLLRYLDCAVIRYLHGAIESSGEPSFDTVRGLFNEGDELYPGSGFKQKTHIQIAVNNKDVIKGFFRVPRTAKA